MTISCKWDLSTSGKPTSQFAFSFSSRGWLVSYLLLPWEDRSNRKWTILSSHHKVYQWSCICANKFVFPPVKMNGLYILIKIFLHLFIGLYIVTYAKTLLLKLSIPFPVSSQDFLLDPEFPTGLCPSECKPTIIGPIKNKTTFLESLFKKVLAIIWSFLLYFTAKVLKSIVYANCLLLFTSHFLLNPFTAGFLPHNFTEITLI